MSKEKQDEKPNRGSEKRDVRDLALRSLFQFLRSKCLDYIDFTIYGPSVAWQLSEIILVLAKKELFKVYMSASKSNPLKLFSQSLVSSPFSLLNICQQYCHFPFSFCKVHTGLKEHMVTEMPSSDLFFHVEKFSNFAQLSHNLCRTKILSLQALFWLPIDIRGLFLRWKYIPSNEDFRIRSVVLPNEGRSSSRPSSEAARRVQQNRDQGGHLNNHPC